MLSGAAPWRRFRWYHGQKHYSGSYWSATEALARAFSYGDRFSFFICSTLVVR